MGCSAARFVAPQIEPSKVIGNRAALRLKREESVEEKSIMHCLKYFTVVFLLKAPWKRPTSLVTH